MKEINLLQKKRQLTSGKTLRLVRILAIGFLLLVTLSSTSLFFINSRSPLVKLQKEEVHVLSNLSMSQRKIAKLIVLDDRLRNISSLSTNRPSYDKTMDIILNQASQEVQVNEIKINKEKIIVSASGLSVSTINTFIENMTKLSDKEKSFKKIILNGISVNSKTGIYSLSIDINLL